MLIIINFNGWCLYFRNETRGFLMFNLKLTIYFTFYRLYYLMIMINLTYITIIIIYHINPLNLLYSLNIPTRMYFKHIINRLFFNKHNILNRFFGIPNFHFFIKPIHILIIHINIITPFTSTYIIIIIIIKPLF